MHDKTSHQEKSDFFTLYLLTVRSPIIARLPVSGVQILEEKPSNKTLPLAGRCRPAKGMMLSTSP
jgi:hypothetical protein